MKYSKHSAYALIALLLPIIMTLPALATPETSAHSSLAWIKPYLIASRQQEIALARSAAPPAISMNATVMVLGTHGNVTAVKGSNGFVCLVTRSWDNSVGVKSADFWNPKFRAPYCFNAAAAQSVLPRYLMRTKWVLAGASMGTIGHREKVELAAGKLKGPASGAMSYMMSKLGSEIGNQTGPWRPHVMFYFPRAQAPGWGANLRGIPLYADADENVVTLYVLLPVWSDGSPAPAFK